MPALPGSGNREEFNSYMLEGFKMSPALATDMLFWEQKTLDSLNEILKN